MRYKVIFSYFIFGLVMFQYQNCAPSNQNLDYGLGGEMTGIDSVNPGPISFPQGKVSAFANEGLSVTGLCEQSGALIGWKLENANGDVIERGLAECNLGSFQVDLNSDWSNFCNQNFMLKAALGVDAASETQVEAFCD